MATVKMKAPRNSGGFTVGSANYVPDAEGYIDVAGDHVDAARSHGFVPSDPVVAEAAPASDPNVMRVGDPQAQIQPGGDASAQPATNPAPAPAPSTEPEPGPQAEALTAAEEAQALADAAVAKGALLDETEKAEVIAEVVAKKATTKKTTA